jgi:hypothetical protein
VKAGASDGVRSERFWPYLVDKSKDKPPTSCFELAMDRTIQSYRRIVGLQEVKSCLAGGSPVFAGIVVYSNMLADETAKTGLVDVPAPGDKEQG